MDSNKREQPQDGNPSNAKRSRQDDNSSMPRFNLPPLTSFATGGSTGVISKESVTTFGVYAQENLARAQRMSNLAKRLEGRTDIFADAIHYSDPETQPERTSAFVDFDDDEIDFGESNSAPRQNTQEDRDDQVYREAHAHYDPPPPGPYPPTGGHRPLNPGNPVHQTYPHPGSNSYGAPSYDIRSQTSGEDYGPVRSAPPFKAEKPPPNERITFMTLGRESIDELPAEGQRCGNCFHEGHRLIDCAVPARAGVIFGCPWCNTSDHLLDYCPRWEFVRDTWDQKIPKKGFPIRVWVRYDYKDKSLLMKDPDSNDWKTVSENYDSLLDSSKNTDRDQLDKDMDDWRAANIPLPNLYDDDDIEAHATSNDTTDLSE
ncbi:hypothetical protein CcaCcLH18_11777 [Colletotrichum camelliae]|nr:hypothetical protein CcaCcLH18_11777 [Colletotrichum camelliae]